MLISFELKGKPFGKQRPRVNTHTRRAYTPQKTRDYEKALRWSYKKASRQKAPKGVPVTLYITAYYAIPKNTSKANTTLMIEELIPPTVKPDIDNIVKIVMDALNKLAYEDDNQVTELHVKKRYSKAPRMAITIQWEEL